MGKAKQARQVEAPAARPQALLELPCLPAACRHDVTSHSPPPKRKAGKHGDRLAVIRPPHEFGSPVLAAFQI